MPKKKSAVAQKSAGRRKAPARKRSVAKMTVAEPPAPNIPAPPEPDMPGPGDATCEDCGLLPMRAHALVTVLSAIVVTLSTVVLSSFLQ